jgi:hypothetical protein
MDELFDRLQALEGSPILRKASREFASSVYEQPGPVQDAVASMHLIATSAYHFARHCTSIRKRKRGRPSHHPDVLFIAAMAEIWVILHPKHSRPSKFFVKNDPLTGKWKPNEFSVFCELGMMYAHRERKTFFGYKAFTRARDAYKAANKVHSAKIKSI